MNEKQLLEAISMLINHLNDDSLESSAPVEAGLMNLRDLL
jgi:hypothetical protein